MSSLSWRPATKDDRSRLQAFTCAVPETRPVGSKRPVHLKPWEVAVQKYFRILAWTDTNADTNQGFDGRLLLGFDGDALVACVAHCLLRDLSHETAMRNFLGFEGSVRFLKALGISLDYRRQGGAIADEALDVAVEDMIVGVHSIRFLQDFRDGAVRVMRAGSGL